MSRLTRFVLFVTGLVVAFALNPLGQLATYAQTSSEEVVYSDNMSTPSTGLMSEVSSDPARFSYAYVNGQFIVQAVETSFTGEIFSYIGTPEITNSITSVDAGIGGADESNNYVFVGCRAGANNDGYFFLLDPTAGLASLWRIDPDNQVQLAETDVSGLVTPGVNQFNRIEINCFLDLISASVNGEVVLAEFDDTYTTGASYIGIGNYSALPANLFGVFDNLTVTDQGSLFDSAETPPANVTGDLNTTFTNLKNAALTQPSAAGPTQIISGPSAGVLTDKLGGVLTTPAGVNVAGFFATATFLVPSDVSTPWD